MFRNGMMKVLALVAMFMALPYTVSAAPVINPEQTVQCQDDDDEMIEPFI